MARISGIDLPRDKRIEVALTYIYGIGPARASEVLAKTGINPDTRVKDLTEEDAWFTEQLSANQSEGAFKLLKECIKPLASAGYMTTADYYENPVTG